MNKPNTNAARVRRRTQRMREIGLVPRQVWAHPLDWPAIEELRKRLQKARDIEGNKLPFIP